MNQAKRVLIFSVLATFCLLIVSVFIHYNRITNSRINNIDIIANVVDLKKDSIKQPEKQNKIGEERYKNFISDSFGRKFQSFDLPNRLTNYELDTNKIVLDRFIKKLIALQRTKKGKIRIAYFGDSMIEGDLISQTLRKKLQLQFGGAGVGFMPITSAVAGFRQTATHTFTTNFKECNFKQKTNNFPLYLSGRNYIAQGYNKVEIADNTTKNTLLNKYLLFSNKSKNSSVVFNGAYKNILGSKLFNRILFDASISNKLKFEVSDASFALFGFSFESNDGVIVDNFSFRGLGGFEFTSIDSNFLKQIQEEQPYDLIIMQYGVNVLNNPNNNSFGWYEKAMINCISKMKRAFDSADFLIVSSADKFFKYNDGVHTAIGMENLIETEQRIAFETKSAFFNTYKTMGGYNSLLKWSNTAPIKAAKDGTHLNSIGAEYIGNSLFESISYEFNKTNK